MSWVKLDDQFFSHPKVREVGQDGCLLYLAGLTYCARYLTDGLIAKTALPLLAAEAFVKPTVAALLVKAQLWWEDDEGYIVNDYLEYNPSRFAVEADRKRKSEAGAKGAASRWHGTSDGTSHSSSHSNTHATGHWKSDAPVPSPTPKPSTIRAADAAQPFEEQFNYTWTEYPRKVARKLAFKAYQARRRENVGAADLHAAVKHYAASVKGKDPEHIMHGATFFGPNERWKDYLEPVANTNGKKPEPATANFQALADRVCPLGLCHGDGNILTERGVTPCRCRTMKPAYRTAS